MRSTETTALPGRRNNHRRLMRIRESQLRRVAHSQARRPEQARAQAPRNCSELDSNVLYGSLEWREDFDTQAVPPHAYTPPFERALYSLNTYSDCEHAYSTRSCTGRIGERTFEFRRGDSLVAQQWQGLGCHS